MAVSHGRSSKKEIRQDMPQLHITDDMILDGKVGRSCIRYKISR